MWLHLEVWALFTVFYLKCTPAGLEQSVLYRFADLSFMSLLWRSLHTVLHASAPFNHRAASDQQLEHLLDIRTGETANVCRAAALYATAGQTQPWTAGFYITVDHGDTQMSSLMIGIQLFMQFLNLCYTDLRLQLNEHGLHLTTSGKRKKKTQTKQKWCDQNIANHIKLLVV